MEVHLTRHGVASSKSFFFPIKQKRNCVGALVVAVALTCSNFAIAQPATTQVSRPNRVTVEYLTPKGSELGGLYQALKEHHALEKLQKILSPLRLPEERVVKTMECGKVNAWYRRDDMKPTVTICYELLNQVLASLPKETTAHGISSEDAKAGQLLWLALHEVGHAAFDILGVSIFGNEEIAADNFASYVMLQFAEARQLIIGAAWRWNAYVQNYKVNPIVQVRLAGFASDHGLPQERFYSVLCMAFGANPVLFADFVQEGYLPATRAANCVREYMRFAKSFEKVIGPHIDYELAKGIVEANWIPAPVLKEAPQK
jgi:Putative metallopeptidase